jgi:hypothetical protein
MLIITTNNGDNLGYQLPIMSGQKVSQLIDIWPNCPAPNDFWPNDG